MGYRSEVAIELAEKEAKILELLCEQDEDLKTLVGACDQRDGCESLYWGSIKWYEGYKDVDKINTFLENIDPESYCLIRLGEEYDDTERLGYKDASIYISRSIERW